MRSEVLTLEAHSDWSLARTVARYRKVRGFLAPFLVVALGGLLVPAFVAEPEQVVMATVVVFPLVFAVRNRLSKDPLYGDLLADIFLWGFLLRVFVGLVIYHFKLWEYYGGDSRTYDRYGWELAEVWHGRIFRYEELDTVLRGPNPGIYYFTAAVYYVFGHYLLLLQFVLSVIGAAAAILVVKIADTLFGDREISVLSGVLVAFFPSMVMWTSQLMKEGLLLFLFSLVFYSMQQAVIRFRLRYAVYIVAALLAIHYIRFYMFYSMLAAIAAALIAPSRPISPVKLVRHLAVSGIVLASVLYLLGGWDILRTFQEHTKLETIQEARLDQAITARSGFERLADVSTPEGALRHLPFGFLYVMFGPFPWEVSNLRQLMALPEGLFWWVMVPALLRGLWLALRHRLPESWLILSFIAGVALPYSFSQGNVGTAYRQRVQVQIFLFIFVALGYVWKKRQRLARALTRQVVRTRALGAKGRI